MITGQSIVIQIQIEPSFFFDHVLRVAKMVWPLVVVEDGNSGVLINHLEDDAFAGVREIMIYRDISIRNSWTNPGPSKEELGLMIHVIASWDHVTFVVDKPDQATDAGKIVKAIHSLFSHERTLPISGFES